AGSTDNCTIAQYQIDGAASRTFTCADVGAPFGAALTVIDQSGNDASAAVTIQVVDDVDPVARGASAPVSLPLDDSGLATLTPDQIDAGSSDNCTSTLTRQLSRTNFSCADI